MSWIRSPAASGASCSSVSASKTAASGRSKRSAESSASPASASARSKPKPYVSSAIPHALASYATTSTIRTITSFFGTRARSPAHEFLASSADSPAHEFFCSRKLRLAPQDYSPWTPPSDRFLVRSYPPASRHPRVLDLVGSALDARGADGESSCHACLP